MKKFLLECFFKNEKFAGWRNIAENLIDSGECIVAGTNCIWKGGIGNFITLETPSKEYIGCIKYKFDLDYFKTSLWFKETLLSYLSQKDRERESLLNQLEELETEIDELKTIL